jgi:hypothetical protein
MPKYIPIKIESSGHTTYYDLTLEEAINLESQLAEKIGEYEGEK